MSADPTPIAYRKCCRRLGLFSASTLYEADDHFLLVEGLIKQRCRRFYFDRIQAILVRPTFLTGLELILSGLPVVVVIVLGIFFVNEESFGEFGATLFLGSPFIALFLILLIRFLLHGASQRVVFQTAVQSAAIPALGYRRSSQKHLQRIRGVIEQAQGGRWQPTPQEAPPTRAAQPTIPSSAAPPPDLPSQLKDE